MSGQRKPVVLVTTDHKRIGNHYSLVVGRKYADAVVETADCFPLLLPSLGQAVIDHGFESLMGRVDGIVFTGSPSNIEPHHYEQELAFDPALRDPHRDATTLPLIRWAMSCGLPVFAICRGFQEVNVALGGELHQKVHEVSGLMDHREDESLPLDDQYGPAHDISIAQGGLLSGWLGVEQIKVNSLHGQGIKRLAEPLRAEAFAPDGLVEAFSAKTAPGFLFGVQWHPEWQARHNPISRRLFQAFGDACRTWLQSHCAET